MLKVGLTGGIGSGKSTVASYFATFGVEIIDTDKIAHEITQPKQITYQKIVKHFGANVLQPDKTLDRKRIREIIFNQQQQKTWLEDLLHPKIIAIMQKRMQSASSPYSIAVVPLLVETELMPLFDRILVIETTENQQLLRIAQRDRSTNDQISKIIQSQCSQKERLQHADDIITNTDDLDSLHHQVCTLNKKYLILSY